MNIDERLTHVCKIGIFRTENAEAKFTFLIVTSLGPKTMKLNSPSSWWHL